MTDKRKKGRAKTPRKEYKSPTKFHIDRRASRLLEDLAGDDAAKNNPDLLSTQQLSNFLNVSEQWLEQARSRGDGPNFLKFGKTVRYRKPDVQAWLEDRVQKRTSAVSR